MAPEQPISTESGEGRPVSQEVSPVNPASIEPVATPELSSTERAEIEGRLNHLQQTAKNAEAAAQRRPEAPKSAEVGEKQPAKKGWFDTALDGAKGKRDEMVKSLQSTRWGRNVLRGGKASKWLMYGILGGLGLLSWLFASIPGWVTKAAGYDAPKTSGGKTSGK